MTPWTAACQASLSFTISWSLLKLKSVESVIPSNHFIPRSPFFLLPSMFPSIRVFSSELAFHIRWPKYWSVSFSISPSSDIQGWFPPGLTGLSIILNVGNFFLPPYSSMCVCVCMHVCMCLSLNSCMSLFKKITTRV